MKAVILAAGKGTRMGELTKQRPKCTLDFLGKTLIERQVSTLRICNINDIIIVTGYESDKIKCSGCEKIENKNYNTTNMVESLFCTRDYWSEDIIVSYGDIIYEEDVLKKIINSKDDINVAVDLKGASYFKDRFGENFLSKTESLVMGNEGDILEIGESNPDISKVQGQYIGLMKFSNQGLGTLSKIYDKDKKGFQNAYMTDMLQRLINLGKKVKAVCISGGWLEFDSADDYNRYLSWKDENRLEKYYNGIN